MAPLRNFVLPVMAAAAGVRAADISEFVPGCAPSCINEAVETHSTCDVGDSACLCRDIYSLKRHSEDCLTESCSEADYGSAMKGFDDFCNSIGDEPEEPTVYPPPPEETTAYPPPEETTAYPPPEETTAYPPPEETTAYPPPEETTWTASLPIETTDYPAPPEETVTEVPLPTPTETIYPPPEDTSVPGVPLPTPTETNYPPPEDTTDYPPPPPEETTLIPIPTTNGTIPEPTESPEVPAAGASFSTSFSAIVGGLLLATFFRL